MSLGFEGIAVSSSGFILCTFAVSILLWRLCGCAGTGDSTVASDRISGPSALKAYSANETTVGLTWIVSPDEGRSEVQNPAYTLLVKNTGGNLLQTIVINKGQSLRLVGGLTEGVVYLFDLQLNVVAGTPVTGGSISIRWSPAKRRETINGDVIAVYETASLARNGLVLFSALGNGPITVPLVGGSASFVDLYFETDPFSLDFLLRSASLCTLIAAPRTTFFSTRIYEWDDLNYAQEFPPDLSTFTALDIRIPGGESATKGKVIWGRTQDGNYFRILIRRNGPRFYYDTSPNRYLVLRVSYQGIPSVRYAWHSASCRQGSPC